MGRIIWACRAADQLEALVEFIAKGSPREARRFAAGVLRRIALLGTHPELDGWVIEDETRTYRELLLGNYRIIYRTEPGVIYIVAVRHTARRWDVKDVSTAPSLAIKSDCSRQSNRDNLTAEGFRKPAADHA